MLDRERGLVRGEKTDFCSGEESGRGRMPQTDNRGCPAGVRRGQQAGVGWLSKALPFPPGEQGRLNRTTDTPRAWCQAHPVQLTAPGEATFRQGRRGLLTWEPHGWGWLPTSCPSAAPVPHQ